MFQHVTAVKRLLICRVKRTIFQGQSFPSRGTIMDPLWAAPVLGAVCGLATIGVGFFLTASNQYLPLGTATPPILWAVFSQPAQHLVEAKIVSWPTENLSKANLQVPQCLTYSDLHTWKSADWKPSVCVLGIRQPLSLSPPFLLLNGGPACVCPCAELLAVRSPFRWLGLDWTS